MLSEHVSSLIAECFSPDQQLPVQLLLESECAENLPLTKHNRGLIDRIQVAVIKLSQGDIDKVRQWIGESKEDWRDVLDAAGFYSDTMGHLTWRPQKTDKP